MAIYQLLYLSTPTAPLSEADVLALQTTCRRNNQQQDITGLLLYSPERFVQVLEGEEAAVRRLFERIQQDSRHHDIVLLRAEPIPHRRFADWSMNAQPLPSYQPLFSLIPEGLSPG